MSTVRNETTEAIAQRLRLEREARGWSLADLAARSGVARASISRIERGEMSPTAALLVRLAGAFDLTLAGLLIRAEAAASRLTRTADQPVWRDPATGYTRTQVFMRPDHPVELVQVTMPPGGQAALPASSYALIRQVIQVQSGQLTVTEGDGDTHHLHAGDSLGFGPPADVVIANTTAHPCTYLVALARS